MDDSYHPDNLRLTPELVALNQEVKAKLRNSSQPKRKPRKAISGDFLPAIPLSWVAKATRLPGKALEVALAIRRCSALAKSLTMPLPNGTLKLFGVDVYSKSRALSYLEKAGLIQVERKPGCNPIVTIIEVDDTDIKTVKYIGKDYDNLFISDGI